MRICVWTTVLGIMVGLGASVFAQPMRPVPPQGRGKVAQDFLPRLKALGELGFDPSLLERFALSHPKEFQFLLDSVKDINSEAAQESQDTSVAEGRRDLVVRMRKNPHALEKMLAWIAKDLTANTASSDQLHWLFDGASRETISALVADDAETLSGVSSLLTENGVSAEAARIHAPWFLRKDGERHLVRMAAARAAGLTWKRVGDDFEGYKSMTSPGRVSKLFNQPLYRYHGRIETPAGGEILGNPDLKKNHVKLFPAEFVALPFQFFKEGTPRDGIPSEANLFSMVLPEEEIARTFGEKYQSFSFTHFENSFGYIRFYTRGDDVIISEIQSELFAKLQTPEQRFRYEHWSRVLLLAFEQYIQEVYFSKRNSANGRILIAGEDYQKRRWKNTKIGDGLTRMLYRDLPKLMGYAPENGIQYGFEWPQHLEGPERKEIQKIEQGWSLPASGILAAEGPFRSEFQRRLQSQQENRFDAEYGRLSQTLQKVKSIHLVPRLPLTSRGRTSEKGPFENVLQSRISLAAIPGMTAEFLQTYSDLLRSLPESLHGLLNPVWTWISRGSDNPDETPKPEIVAGPPGPVEAVGTHFTGQDRHPHLIASGAAIGIKGGGARRDQPDGYEDYSLSGAMPGRRLPVYLTLEKGKPARTLSHRYWGGLTRQEGEITFLNLLALHALMRTVDDGRPAAANIPYDIGVLEELPFWSHAQTARVPARQYRKRYLEGAPVELATLRTIGPTDMRISYAVAALLDQDYPADQWQSRIQKTILGIYRAFGEEPSFPNEPLLAGGEGGPSVAQVLGYLKRIYEQNQEKVERMLVNLEEKSLKTLAAVQGAGGHLGGIMLSFDVIEDENSLGIRMFNHPIGAPNGGAPAMRNMSVTGELHDLDANVYFPWLNRPDLTSDRRLLEEASLKEIQRKDLLYWETSIYWMRNILRGRDIPAEGTLIEYPFGDPQKSGLMVIPMEFDHQSEQSQRLLKPVEESGLVFVEPKHAGLYEDFFQRGRKYRD